MLKPLISLTVVLLSFNGPVFADTGGWPRTIPHEAGELTLNAAPESVVSTSPSVTGILLAIDAPLTASAATTPGPITDDKGFFRQWADLADARGVEVLYPSLSFDIEALIQWWPDLVIVSTTGADSALPYFPMLEQQGIPSIAVNYANRSWQDLARQLGSVLGLEDKAENAIAEFDAQISDIAKGFSPHKGKSTIVGYQLAGTFSVGKTNSPQALVLEALGFDIVGLPEHLRSKVTRSSNFDFISRENLSDAIEGETVFLLNGTRETVAAFKNDPVLANLPAVQKDQVYALGPTSFRIDYFSGLEMGRVVAEQFRAN